MGVHLHGGRGYVQQPVSAATWTRVSRRRKPTLRSTRASTSHPDRSLCVPLFAARSNTEQRGGRSPV